MKSVFGLIYKATNIINGKAYVGQTVNFKNRISSHLNCAKNGDKQAFYRAIRKYGADAFTWEVIDSALSKEELNEKEKHWINELNTCTKMSNSHGYNMTEGGDGFGTGEDNPMFGKRGEEANFYGRHHTDEVKNRLRELKLEQFSNKENHPFFGRSHSDEAKEKMSKTKSIIYAGKGNPFYGKSHSEESKNKIRNSKKGVINKKKRKPLTQFSLDGEIVKKFESPLDVIAELNLKRSASITACCRGSQKTAYGYIWIYDEDFSEELLKERLERI